MNSSFALIDGLIQFLGPLDAQWFVSGGWAIDIYLNRVTRKRCDLDISVAFPHRRKCIQFFLEKDWRIEGKLAGGFKTVRTIIDYSDDIHYFWSFQKDAAFISEYVDGNGNRRIAYDRDHQPELDYIEVFLDLIEDHHFVFRDFPEIKRHEKDAILEREGVKYLAPEVVLLLKSRRLTEKNKMDFSAVVSSMDGEVILWLIEDLLQVHGSTHPWLEQLDMRRNSMGPV